MCPLSCDFIENKFGYFSKKKLGQKSENCQRYSKNTEPFIISGPPIICILSKLIELLTIQYHLNLLNFAGHGQDIFKRDEIY